MATTFQVTFDCADPNRVASFWAEVLGYKLQDPPGGYDTWEDWLRDHGVPEEDWNSASAVVDPEGKLPRLYFQRVPEPKTVKNRVHLDVNVSAGTDGTLEARRAVVNSEVERLVGLGARVVRPGKVSELGEYWVVLQDPEGNELCLQ
ncbi:MAG: VOC family protein [Chloroflexota bacterium]|nr:VOC family protein [Chloroflexota bacterium]